MEGERSLPEVHTAPPQAPLKNAVRHRVTLLMGAVGLLVTGAVWLAVAVWFSEQVHRHFDEAYNLNQAVTFARLGLYGVHVNGHVELFDPKVTSGPGLLVPLALALRIWGADLQTVRYVLIVGLLLSGGVLWSAARQYLHPNLALVFVWATFTTPRIVFFGISVMGEVAALAYLFAYVALWDFAQGQRKASVQLALSVCAGGLLALAILTKTICALLLPASLWVVAQEWLHDRSWKRCLMLLVPAIAAVGLWLAWSLYQAWFVGTFGGVAYLRWHYQYEAASQTLRNAVIVARPLQYFVSHWQESWRQYGVITLVALLAGPAWLLLRMLRMRFSRCLAITPGLRVLQVAVVIWFGWFYVFSGPQANSRHLVTAIVFMLFLILATIGCLPIRSTVPVVSSLTAEAQRRHSLTKYTTAAVLIALILSLTVNAAGGYQFFVQYAAAARNRRSNDLTVAHWVNTQLPDDARLTGWGWWVPWSLAYLSDRTAGRVELRAIVPEMVSEYVVRLPEMARAPDPRFDVYLAQYGTLIYEHGDYEIYRLTPETVPIQLARLRPDRVVLRPEFSLWGQPKLGLSVESVHAVPGTVIYIDGVPVETVYSSPSLLTAYIPAGVLAQPGKHAVFLRTARSQSNEAAFMVELP